MAAILPVVVVTLAGSCLMSCEDDEQVAKQYNLSGLVQKGPFVLGSTILIQELDKDFNPTGRTFTTNTTDDTGSFITTVTLKSSKVQIIATGFYFNEVKGSLSEAPLTLRALVDLEDDAAIHVNILTTMVHDRMLFLAADDQNFRDAKSQAENELLTAFGLQSLISDFENLDITQSEILLGLSAIIQGRLTVAEMSELLNKIAQDLAAMGSVGQKYMTQLVVNAGEVVPSAVQQNLLQRYENLGQTITAPNIENVVRLFLTGTLSMGPAIASFSPSIGTWGDTVTIAGQYFSTLPSKNTVSFGSYSSQVIGSTPETVTCIVPANVWQASTSITVTVAGKSTTSFSEFSFAAPLIRNFSPIEGNYGDVVTIRGKHFNKEIAKNLVRFNEYTATVQEANDSILKVVVPNTLTSRLNKITITSNLQSGISTESFVALPIVLMPVSSIPGSDPIFGRYGTASFSVGGKGYVGLGNAGNRFWSYEPITNSWNEIAPYPGKLEGNGGVKGFGMNGFGYAYGHGEFWKYNPTSNTWEMVSDEVHGTGLVIGNKVYFFQPGATDNFWEFDPANASWTKQANAPIVSGAPVFGINNRFYILVTPLTFQPELWEFDIQSSTWSKKAPVPWSVKGEGLTANGFGFVTHSEVIRTFTYTDTFRYNASADAWTATTDLPIGQGPAIFEIYGKIYLGAGFNGSTGKATLYELHPSFYTP